MAYNSTRNYAQEIQDMIKAGGDPAKVNQLLNERLEKQQSIDTGYSTYDDVYRQAMDYITGSGATPTASANVDYAEIANQIMASQGADADDMTHRSWSDLGTVLDAREKKLATGQYDRWKNSTIDGGDNSIAYNGENSVHQMLQDYATYTQQMQDYYQQAADILRGQGDGSYGGGGYSGGYGGSYPSGGGSGGSGGGTAVLAPVKTGPTTYTSGTEPVQLGLTESAWEQKKNRDAARDAVAVTNAATRVPVQGEISSYVQGTTQDAFDQAVQALLAEGDKDGALALRQAQEQYEATGKMNIQMPEPKGGLMEGTYVSSSGTPSRTVRPSTGGGLAGGSVELVPEDPLYPGVPNVQTGGGTVSAGNGAAGSGMTDAEMDAILAELGFSNVPVFSFAGTEFDNATLGSQRGDTAVQQAARILSGGSSDGGTAAPVVVPQTTTVVTQDMVDDGYQAAMDAARAAGDYGSVNQIANDWNRYKEETGRTNPQNLMTSYTVEGLGRVDTETMDKYMRMGIVEAVIGRDGAPKFVYTGTSGLSQR